MFCDLLKDLRLRKGVTQTDLAKAIGVSNGNVGDWERGRSKPGYDALISLSRFFEISPARLLELPIQEPNYICDGIPLAEAESDLVAMFRLLESGDRKTIFDLTKLKYEQTCGGKASIYSTYSDTNEQQKSAPGSDDEVASGNA
ncbi:helix-turn-helix transcriptional regulator [Oscillibacter sp.]|uniref:helix-turn-helix domain-containing protein n=1 Tax=Oscillibacter sp. TaxID=1945593 RepID=UPI0028AF50C2|nr:helix-turn-helix transcriptional regulator [Oscillibacter sp.]